MSEQQKIYISKQQAYSERALKLLEEAFQNRSANPWVTVLNSHEAAGYIGVSYSTITKWRILGIGPKFIRAGPRRVVYRLHDLDEYLDEHICASTSGYKDL